ncbi:MAG TPA: hypothetical protein VJ721_09610, partial [Chthoniobacterales bacterium]|nr:hypothetical protein [Chthoniobacterales bacterium]
MKSKLRSGIALGLTLAGIVTMSLSFKAAPGGGNPGDLVATVHFSRDCDGPGGIGVGVAYDGAGHLWISCANDTVDLMRANAATGVVDQTYTIHGGLGALAYDSVHNAIWAGPWGPNDNRVWIIRLDAARNVTSAEPRFVPTAGAARGADDGIAYDASDNSIYYSSDGSTTIGHYNADNSALIDTFTWTGQDSQCANSGLAVGGNYLFQGADGCNHIWVADKHTKANVFHFSTYIANDSNHRDEGLSCDPDTYAASGKEVMWSKEAYSPNRASAFLIPNGTCGAGGQPPPPPSPTPTPTPTATPTPTPTPIGSPTPTPTPTPTATIAACTIVTNTGDSGAGSLRAAIDCANAHPGADTITFNIPSSDPGCHLVPGVGTVCTIQTAGLPIISDTATIDGYTQPGSSPNTLAVGDNAKVLIELDGTNAITSGIYINAPDVTVRGLVINRFHDQGIINDRGNGVFTNTSGTVVEGCFIGVDPTGTIALPNGKDAVSIHGLGAQSIRVGGASPAQRNILSGNGGLSPFGNPIGVGVLIVQQAGGVQVFGNYIGTDRNGTAPIPNVGGVAIDRNGSPNRNQIGGPNPGERNVISGNLNPGLNPGAGYGVALSGGDGDDIVQGNYIGIGADGVTPVGNSEEGVLLGFRNNSPGFLIGGPNPGQGNVISSNGGNGIFSAFSNSNTYQGNLIGTAADGTTPRGNTLNGIICSSSNGETIGGTALGAGNVIAFNGRKGVVLNAGSGGPQSV